MEEYISRSEKRICVSVFCFVISQPQHASVFFFVVVLFCTGAAEEWTPACGRTVALRMSTESLLLCRAEREAEQFIPDRKTVCRVCRVSSSQRLPHGYTAPLTASVCLWARWQTYTWHTSLIIERVEGRLQDKILYKIKKRYSIKWLYIARALPFSICRLRLSDLRDSVFIADVPQWHQDDAVN